MAETMLTNSEWYVLDCLWERAPQTVTQLVPILKEKVGWAKSTTITTLRRMEEKGLVRVEVRGRAKHYFPAVERERAARQVLPGGGAGEGRPPGDPLLPGPGVPGERGSDGVLHGPGEGPDQRRN